jgi:hypothetical protein
MFILVLKQWIKACCIMALIFLGLGSGSAFGRIHILPQTNIQMSSKELFQGGLILITIAIAKDFTPSLGWMGKEIFLCSNPEKTKWYGFLDANLGTPPGMYEALLNLGSAQDKMEIEIKAKDYGLRTLTVPKEFVDLDEPTLERVKKENIVMYALWHAAPLPALWSGPFSMPLDGEVIGDFGVKSIINDQPRAPHTGVDLRAETGTPIKAANHGRVVLVADHFFTGLTVVLDHGGGIQSMYFHLDQILVETGQIVSKGEVLGLVGSTGRATGPHLHFGVRVNGTAVDPLSLIALREQILE